MNLFITSSISAIYFLIMVVKALPHHTAIYYYCDPSQSTTFTNIVQCTPESFCSSHSDELNKEQQSKTAIASVVDTLFDTPKVEHQKTAISKEQSSTQLEIMNMLIRPQQETCSHSRCRCQKCSRPHCNKLIKAQDNNRQLLCLQQLLYPHTQGYYNAPHHDNDCVCNGLNPDTLSDECFCHHIQEHECLSSHNPLRLQLCQRSFGINTNKPELEGMSSRSPSQVPFGLQFRPKSQSCPETRYVGNVVRYRTGVGVSPRSCVPASRLRNGRCVGKQLAACDDECSYNPFCSCCPGGCCYGSNRYIQGSSSRTTYTPCYPEGVGWEYGGYGGNNGHGGYGGNNEYDGNNGYGGYGRSSDGYGGYEGNAIPAIPAVPVVDHVPVVAPVPYISEVPELPDVAPVPSSNSDSSAYNTNNRKKNTANRSASSKNNDHDDDHSS